MVLKRAGPLCGQGGVTKSLPIATTGRLLKWFTLTLDEVAPGKRSGPSGPRMGPKRMFLEKINKFNSMKRPLAVPRGVEPLFSG